MAIGALGDHGEHAQKLVVMVIRHALAHAQTLHQQMAGKRVPVILLNLDTVETHVKVNISPLHKKEKKWHEIIVLTTTLAKEIATLAINIAKLY
jgi:hypothetical protein